jgi:hypothetical protein
VIAEESVMRKRPGDPVALGDIVGHPMEPFERWGRVVGIRKDDCKPIHRTIIRLFVNAQERWPSGEYLTSAFLVAWEGHS